MPRRIAAFLVAPHATTKPTKYQTAISSKQPGLPFEYIYNPTDKWDNRHGEILQPLPRLNEFTKKKLKLKRPEMQLLDIAAAYTYPLLDKDQEKHLFRQMNYCKMRANEAYYAEGDYDAIANYCVIANDNEALILGCNLRLVINIVTRKMKIQRELSEVLSDGNIALLHAIRRFDYALDFKFSTYAYWAVIKKIYRYHAENRDLHQLFTTGHHRSLFNSLPDTEAKEAKGVDIQHWMANLSEREAIAVGCRIGLDSLSPTGNNVWTLQQLGNRLGVTRERARQIYRGAIDKIAQSA